MDRKGQVHGRTAGRPTRVQNFTDSTRKKHITESRKKYTEGKKNITFYLPTNQLEQFQEIKDEVGASSNQDVLVHLMDL